jgi:hypothetical protein
MREVLVIWWGVTCCGGGWYEVWTVFPVSEAESVQQAMQCAESVLGGSSGYEEYKGRGRGAGARWEESDSDSDLRAARS